MADLATALGCTVFVGVRVGDAIVFVDHVGEELTQPDVHRAHPRPSPALHHAAGKTLLANVGDDEMYRLLDLAAPD